MKKRKMLHYGSLVQRVRNKLTARLVAGGGMFSDNHKNAARVKNRAVKKTERQKIRLDLRGEPSEQ